MNPRGPIPQVQSKLDDLVLDMDCSAEAQVDNTKVILGCFAQVLRDGRVSESDLPYIAAALRHTRLEHRMNQEQSRDVKSVRQLVNPLFQLITSLRAQQQAQRARG